MEFTRLNSSLKKNKEKKIKPKRKTLLAQRILD
jgi:hypothetical protein